MKIIGIEHIGIAVKNIKDGAEPRDCPGLLARVTQQN